MKAKEFSFLMPAGNNDIFAPSVAAEMVGLSVPIVDLDNVQATGIITKATLSSDKSDILVTVRIPQKEDFR